MYPALIKIRQSWGICVPRNKPSEGLDFPSRVCLGPADRDCEGISLLTE